MSNVTISEKCMKGTVRIDKLFHLGSMACFDECLSDIQDFIEEIDLKNLEHSGELEDFAIDRAGYPENEPLDGYDFLEHCMEHNVFGFLAEVHTPSPRDGNESWGSCRVRYFYGESIESIIDMASKWAEGIRK